MKRLLILYEQYTPLIDVILNQVKNVDIVVSKSIHNNDTNFDLIIGIGGYDLNELKECDILTCHKSLLPSFDTDDPIRDAILAGVKVTGITIYYKKSKKIVAQYPVFIANEWHYDDLELELTYLEQSLFPIIIEKILKNEIIDLKNILKTNSCISCHSGNCNSNSDCANCNNCSSSNNGGCKC